FNAAGESLRRLKRALDAADPAAALWDRAKALGVPQRLSVLGVERSMVAEAVRATLGKQYPNPRALDESGLTELLLDALHGRRPSRRTSRIRIDVPGPHGGLEVTRRGPPWTRARGVLIAVHGRGSSADAFVERVRREVPGDVVVVAPQADGCTWYPSGFKNLEANADHLASALAALDATFALAAEHVTAERVAIVGFSQGACLALSWLAHRGSRPKPAALAAWTGAAIPGFDTYSDLSGVRTYLGSAAADPWVPLDDVRRTESALVAAGANHTTLVTPSDVHTIRSHDLAALRRHLEILMTGDDLTYQYGFGSALMSEARPDVVPRKQNAPQTLPGGLYSEQINGTGFTVHRGQNHRVWLYRLRPQIGAGGWERLPAGRFTGRFEQGVGSPELLRFAPTPYPNENIDWLAGLSTFAGAGDPAARTGFAIHVYSATADMERAFSSIDGDLLVVPQEGALRVQTELGWLHVTPGQILILPRAIKFRVTLPDGKARGFVGELFNGHYQLPERGPVGANGLADERHFAAPVAAFEDVPGPYEVVIKQGGDLWRSELGASPFDVVGWHGTYAPFKYDLLDFNAYWGANFDHPDPSILTVLTAPHDDHGRNAVDFAVFRGRWDTIEHSFRPPFLHRNSAVEFNAVLLSKATSGPYEAGASTWTPYLSPHGVSVRSYERAAKTSPEANDRPHRIPDDEMWMQFESTYPLRVMPWFLDAEHRDSEYYDQFQGYRPGTAQ
ncbi:MAG: homogentisate 1,2-dioxygenase, partial [Deltaproteobacteria bacterium]|nr:homogentisate 1,2-dioxygenase [Deltaproteobacteria bacterium]